MASKKQILDNMLIEIDEASNIHSQQSIKYKKRNIYMNIPIISISALTSAAAIATFQSLMPAEQIIIWIRLIMGIFGVILTTLTSINAFLNFTGQHTDHKTAHNRYQNLKDFIQQNIADIDMEDVKLNEFILRLADIRESSPSIVKNFTPKLFTDVKSMSSNEKLEKLITFELNKI